jgi:CMP-N-acetylneuraminic acid synthetase
MLAVIPARAGSKGLPGKNLKNLGGKPLIAYTITEARESGVFDKVIVSTEDETIAGVAASYGAEVSFRRPAELATDEAASMDVVLHAVNWLERNEDYTPEVVTVLQPTSPLRKAQAISQANSLFNEKKAHRLVSVKRAEDHHFWFFHLEQAQLRPVLGKFSSRLRRQDLSDVYTVNGAIYMARRETLLREKSFFGTDTVGFVMSRIESLNIDDAFDFLIAEMVLEKGLAGNMVEASV